LHPHKKKKKDVKKAYSGTHQPSAVDEEYQDEADQNDEYDRKHYEADLASDIHDARTERKEKAKNAPAVPKNTDTWFEQNMGKAWEEFLKEWKPYKEWIKDKEKGKDDSKEDKDKDKDKEDEKMDKEVKKTEENVEPEVLPNMRTQPIIKKDDEPEPEDPMEKSWAKYAEERAFPYNKWKDERLKAKQAKQEGKLGRTTGKLKEKEFQQKLMENRQQKKPGRFTRVTPGPINTMKKR
jgi:hypothetical protein